MKRNAKKGGLDRCKKCKFIYTVEMFFVFFAPLNARTKWKNNPISKDPEDAWLMGK